ncbi:hypothetical protein GGR51DRAFT_507881 [Nemania sp. FL0031]|nr:hypothetical protein GGR51DRAFT_507881 [Nemania sp. FL0031]
MNCACRTNSLRIFVQSLTELRITDPVLLRSVRPSYRGSPIAFYRTPAHRPSRLFSSASATHSQQKCPDDSDKPSAGNPEKKPAVFFFGTADDTVTDDLRTSADDLICAKLNGTILDFNPESIDMLVSSLDRASLAEQGAHDDPDAQSQPQSKPKRPAASSQLNIKKYDPSPQPNKFHVKRESWQIQKEALKEKFPEGWRPRKRLSPDALDGIRALHAQFPEQYTTEVLAAHFQVSIEAIRRILKSKWVPKPEEEEERQERWFNRGKAIWSHMAALGKKPPRRWREEGIVREPHWNKKKGPRTEYPYMPERPEGKELVESAQRKLSSNLL